MGRLWVRISLCCDFRELIGLRTYCPPIEATTTLEDIPAEATLAVREVGIPEADAHAPAATEAARRLKSTGTRSATTKGVLQVQREQRRVSSARRIG